MWFSVSGLILAMLGWPFLKVLAFPVFVLLWTIRMPLMISTPLQVALQNLAELFAITFLRLAAGIAVYRDGDAFELSGARLSGVDLFSAMRVMVPVCFFAMAYAYLADKRITWRIGLPVLSLASLVAVASSLGILILWVSDRHIDTGNTLQRWLTGRGAALLALALVVAVHRLALLRRKV